MAGNSISFLYASMVFLKGRGALCLRSTLNVLSHLIFTTSPVDISGGRKPLKGTGRRGKVHLIKILIKIKPACNT